jgi:transcriptional regulator with XRE-family HTH domain
MSARAVGERIRLLRTRQGLTLSELSERAGLSASYLSQIERDKVTPSLGALNALAGALNVGMRDLFEGGGEAAVIFRRAPGSNGRESGTRGFGAVQPVEERLEFAPPNSRLAVWRHVLAPGATSGLLPGYAGEELLFVLSGALVVEVAGESVRLEAGDSIHYDASAPHFWRQDGAHPCVLIRGGAASTVER